MNSNNLCYHVYIKKYLHIETRYVHLTWKTHGISSYATCGTAGYRSILTRNECIEAARKILKISMGPTGYHVGPIENKCIDTNPNHCFTNTRYKSIGFTDVDCPEPHGRVTVGRHVGLICLRQGMIWNFFITYDLFRWQLCSDLLICDMSNTLNCF